MKRFITRIAQLLLFVFAPGLLLAQGKDFRLMLHAGASTPADNIRSVTKESDVFKKSLFLDKYYVTLQFTSLPDQSVKNQLAALGIELIDYIPNLAYTASVPSTVNLSAMKALPLRSVSQFTTEQKTPATLFSGEIPQHAIKQPGYVDLTVVTYEKISAAKITPSLNALNATILADNQVFRSFVVRVPQVSAKALAGLPFVQWAEPIAPPNVLENLPGRTLHRVSILNDGVRNLKGDGINIGIWDGGPVNTSHLDFSPTGRVTIMQGSGTSDHGTHCAGTITSKGIVNPRARGMAPNAKLFSWDFNGDIQAEMAAGIPANNLVVSSHSYGFSFSGACNFNNGLLVYESISRATDINLNNFPSHLHVHSAGNSGTACAGGFHTITGSGKQAKNNLVVANISTTEAIDATSSSGPLQDGRIKPEISAMGTNVFSTWIPGNAYATISGTSMATPGVAGSAALLYQRYKQLNADALPPSSLIKNIICNGAADLGNPGPDYRFGFGRLNALTSVRILEDNRYRVTTVATGAQNDETITVPAGATRLRVMLTWNDPAGALNANPALVNNLDLSVIKDGTPTLPWIVDKNNPAANATRGVDNYSNIEQVTIDNPAAGSYTLRVAGTAVPTGPSQQYSLTWIIDAGPYIEVIFPNGGENLVPGQAEQITWDNSGITGNQTVEFSLNNGANWTTLSTSVAPGTTRFNWTVPVANTSTALVRVSSGAVTDVSDANFSILSAPTGFTVVSGGCSSGEVSFTWTASADATHYDILRMDPVTGDFVVAASNIVGTSHTITGLTPAASLWFALVAKNNTTGSVSSRSNAINGVVSSGGGGLGPVGPITGQNAICGTPNGVAYSVPTVAGATTYTWTAPPGATIASGQGTNSITINYGAGSTSGNVSVIASAGACATPPTTLAVTVNSTPVAAPVSGGNQTTTECPPTPIPTLTATATVPAGHTITWYSAATGGTVVASPTLNTVGTVTYHAESRNTASGCISASRTAVTLTINPATPASITAGGPTTFCSGGSVVLTANSGSSYNWSNGATTQSITVTTGGSYTVVVTQTGGCTGTSAPTVVTVNPSPAATITAGGPTGFCQGGSVVLTASAGSSWLWSNGATTQSITVSTAGAYTVRVTGANGCSTLTPTATNVNVSPLPAVSISATNPPLLLPTQTTSLVLTANPTGGTVVWQKNGTAIAGATGATLANLGVDDAGTYRVLYTSGGCANTSNEIVVGAQSSSNFYVGPNPNQGTFWVRYYNQTNEKVTLTVYDSKGVIVYQRASLTTLPYSRIDVNLGLVGSGSYLVVLHGSNGKQLGAKQIWVGAR